MKPLFAALLPLLLVLSACTDTSPSSTDPGARVYNTNCVTCHQPQGQGIPGVYPPLQQTEWVNGDEGRLIRLVLNGMRGPIEVNGVQYNSVMTAHDFLSDDQIAAVLTYVRSNFGNASGPVSPDDVAAVRAAREHRSLWTADELESRTGISGR